jgi:hypothetical protein
VAKASQATPALSILVPKLLLGDAYWRQAPLGNSHFTLGIAAFLSKAELCTQTGSQAGAWEPEEKDGFRFVFRC